MYGQNTFQNRLLGRTRNSNFDFDLLFRSQHASPWIRTVLVRIYQYVRLGMYIHGIMVPGMIFQGASLRGRHTPPATLAQEGKIV